MKTYQLIKIKQKLSESMMKNVNCIINDAIPNYEIKSDLKHPNIFVKSVIELNQFVQEKKLILFINHITQASRKILNVISLS